MTVDSVQVAFLIGAVWLLWRFFRPYFLKSPLDDIPGPPSPSFLKGNIPQIFDRSNGWNFQKDIGGKYGSVVRIAHMFGRQALFVFDPKALHSIIVKDQNIYEKSSFQISFGNLLLGPGILTATGERHRLHRKSLNPVFSIAHMRSMTPVFYEVMHKLREAVRSEIKGSAGEVDVLSWMGRAALELIGQGGLGYSFDPLVADMEDTYGHALKTIQPAVTKMRTWVMFTRYLHWLGPAWFRRFLVKFVPNSNLQHLKLLIDTIDERSRGIFLSKKAALLRGDEDTKQQVGHGKDIMSILLKMNMEVSEGDRLSENEVVAQMSTLVFAAMDTTSNALARTLQLLAQHPDVQEKLRREIIDARNGQDIPYDSLVDLPYLDAICRETLRLYPPVAITTREAHQDVIMPLSKSIHREDGGLINEIYVPRGTVVLSSNWMSNTNKELWGEDADEWKPERWLSPLPATVRDARIPGIYSNLMTFLGGSRACIGFKFSQLEMKVVLSILVESFKFSPSDKSICWNFAGIAFPTVGMDNSKPSLPLRVETLEKSE